MRRTTEPSPWRTIIASGLLLVIFATVSYLAARTKSPTFDEPLHAVGGWLHLRYGDYRINPEDPPLWKYWAALPNRADALRFDANSDRWEGAADDIYHEWPFTVETLYPCGRSLPLGSDRCPDSDGFVMRGRRMMLAFGVALGAMIAWWGWRLGGPVAAVAATLLFTFDPTFLGHAALVKNDVPLAFVTLALAFAVWRAGSRMTPWTMLAIGLLCAAAVTVKFSGLLLGPIVAVMLLLRALAGGAWETSWRRYDGRGARVGLAVAVLAIAAIVSWCGIWAAYGFRFGPSRDPSVQLNLARMGMYTAMTEYTVEHGRPPSEAEMEQWQPSRMTQAIVWLNVHRLMPEAWLCGLLYTYQSALARDTYLLGQFSKTGWWYYFPFAMLVKTPLATLLAGAGSLAILSIATRRAGWKPIITWTAACLLIPPALFLGSAMRSNLNLGLRHVLPVYPFIFLGTGLAAAYAWRHWRVNARRVATVLAIGLALETLVAFPNFIAFFNTAAGGSRGGLKLLGDSNLDWGQDLKLLSQWQDAHPGQKLYLVYFGLADPWAYGIDYVNFPQGYAFGPQYELRGEQGILAISATELQGIYQDDVYERLRGVEPLEVLGGTIYLYQWPPPRFAK